MSGGRGSRGQPARGGATPTDAAWAAAGRRRAAGAAALALALLRAAAAPAGAADDAGGAAPELLLFEQPLVTSATKAPVAAAAAPSSVSVITREDIRRNGYRTLADALRSQRSFYASYDRNYTYLGVRGFLRPGDFNDRILVLVNGHAYNGDIYLDVPMGPEFGIDMEAIERIEVVRGPGSALYGGNALFAVVNVVTSTALEQPGVHVLAETGSYLRKRSNVRVGHTFGDGTEVFASGSILDLDGHAKLEYPELDRPGHPAVARDADDERAYNAFLSARRRDFYFQGAFNRRRKEIPTGAYDTLLDEDTLTVDSRSFAELGWSRAVRPDLTLTARGYYDGVYYYGSYMYPDGSGGRLRNVDDASSYWGGGELRARWQPAEAHALTAGAEASYHPDAFQDNYDESTPRLTYLDVHRSYGTWGVYLQHEWMLREDLHAVTGVRFDRWDDRLNEVSPRAALVWTPRDGTTVKLLVGRAFRPPNLYEQYYATPAAEPVSLSNADLDAETIITYEATLEQRLPAKALATVGLYHYQIDGLIDVAVLEGGRATQYRNLDNVAAWGAEVELRVPLRDRFWLRADYAYADTRADGRLLSNSPHHLAHAGLLFPLPWRAEGALDLQIVGPRLTLARAHVGTVPLLSLTVSTPPVFGFRVAASVYNLLNQSYDDPGGPEHRQDTIEQDGITFRLGVAYAF